MDILGIDIGGSGIKGAPVNTRTGKLRQERYRIPTPQPSKPQAVAEVVKEIAAYFDWQGPIGCTFPAITKHGVTYSAANVDEAWIHFDAQSLLREVTGLPVIVMNDADAAGVAEMRFGAGRGHQGTVIMLTLGTGIGSAFFVDGKLMPNSELGHLKFRGQDAEDWTSDRIRQEKNLSWKKWGRRVNRYLSHVEFLFSPDLIILGGGVSEEFDRFAPSIEIETQVVPAHLGNDAGIVGAALAARNIK